MALPTNQRDQVLTSIAIIALALVGAYWYFVYNPKTADVDKLAMHVDSLDEANQRARAQVAKGTGRQIRDESAALKQNLDLMRTLVPAGNEVPALLEQVSTAARRAKLDVGGIEPEPVNFLLGFDVPDANSPVTAAAGQPLAVGRDHTA